MTFFLNSDSIRSRAMCGATLVELTIAIVIIGIAVAGTTQVFNLTTGKSADPMIREQALLIAESYMEEILLKKFVDPTSSTVCPAPPAARSSYDNVCDYNGLADTGARDQFGNLVPGLGSYNVAVTVSSAAGVSLNTINNSSVIRVLLVDVTVSGPGATSIALSGYRTNYNCNVTGDPGCRP